MWVFLLEKKFDILLNRLYDSAYLLLFAEKGEKMEVLDLKMVCDYILSKRISKKKISYLEDDVEYMMLTMIKSNDPRMYRFCSDKVKLDYNFVKFYFFCIFICGVLL